MHPSLLFASTFLTTVAVVTQAQDTVAYDEGYSYPWISQCHYYDTIESSCITIASGVDGGCNGMNVQPFQANVYIQQDLCQDFELFAQSIFTDDNFPNSQTFCINSSDPKYAN